jgi:hypothetical protein
VENLQPMSLRPEDLEQINQLGINLEKVLQQIDLFQRPPAYPRLLRPCTIGDGISILVSDQAERLMSLYEQNSKGRAIKFVPASGAATRMFKPLLNFIGQKEAITREFLEKISAQGNKGAQDLITFMDSIREFAFYNDLESVISAAGFRIDSLLQQDQFKKILAFLLLEPGLDYLNLPKGLIQFHRYTSENRTAFEDHLVESVDYVADVKRKCRLHFTVSSNNLDLFQAFLERVSPAIEKRFNVLLQVTFSLQKPSTDTIAVDFENRPFRLEDGKLLFRPGGHGALIENLNDLEGDILFIKNIDNVVPDRLKPQMIRWKKILGGYLLYLQDLIFQAIDKLSPEEIDEQTATEISRFLKEELSIELPPHFPQLSLREKRRILMERLNRPLRVCGMVRNVGEPGGGPFWVRDNDGGSSIQIVENAQVDPSSKEQKAILARATHFNPVDIVCGVKDRWGKPFDLCAFVDSEACIITQKSNDGIELKALELPGLWNGGMAGWITVFLEVPLETFNPVKTVNDLLRKSHQPEE